MNSIPNPDDWMDVLTIVMVSLIIAVPSWLSVRNHRALTKLDKSVSNGHTSPLRADVDEIRDTLTHIREDLHFVKTELGDIRTDLRHERKDRQELDNRFEQFRRTK